MHGDASQPGLDSAMNWFSKFLPKGPLSGKWLGHYVQHNRKFPIEATLDQRGDRIYGTMIDLSPSESRPLTQLLQDNGMSDADIEDFINEIRSQLPGNPTGEIEYRTRLPERSVIEGKIDGSELSFIKRYQGFAYSEYLADGVSMPQSTPCDLVCYTGNITAGYGNIYGEWRITPSFDFEGCVSGSFELNRKFTG